jgi:hypothetical protein
MTTRYGPRPELGELETGQKVMVYRSSNDMRRRSFVDLAIPAVVVKAARVWVDLARSDLDGKCIEYQTWRMRRDTQDEATRYSGSNSRFVTLEQHEWEETRRWARGYLWDQGIDLKRPGTWVDREVELADIIIAAGKNKGGTS